MSDKSQFETGYKAPVQEQPWPGKQSKMKDPPATEYLPTADGDYQKYKAAGDLEGWNAVITGGDSGIGRAIAVLYAMEGAKNILIGYLPEEEDDAQDTKKLVEKYGATVHLLSGDLAKRDACKKLIDTAIERFQTINVLVLNHAVQMVRKNIEELPEEQFELTIQTNLTSFFYLAKYTIPHLKPGSSILVNASINAYIGRPDLLDYTTSKGGIVSFMRGLANQYVDKGIRVNAVAPGPVWTPLVQSTMGRENLEQFTAPIGRPSQPSEVASSFVFLASLKSSSITGQTIHVNGGGFTTS